jgi:DNA-binding MarR family transcriptional regulator
MNGMADDYYDAWLDMLGRIARPRFLALILDRAGVTLEADLLQYLVHLDLRGPTGVLELAGLAGQNHPKVSRSLARLEELGLVTRAAASHDRRVKTAAPTAAGRRTVEAFNEGRRKLLADAFAGWSDHDRAELARLTRRLTDAMATLIEAADRPGAQGRSPSSVSRSWE